MFKIFVFLSMYNMASLFTPKIVFQALQKGNAEGARIHAENSIRQHNQVRNKTVI